MCAQPGADVPSRFRGSALFPTHSQTGAPTATDITSRPPPPTHPLRGRHCQVAEPVQPRQPVQPLDVALELRQVLAAQLRVVAPGVARVLLQPGGQGCGLTGCGLGCGSQSYWLDWGKGAKIVVAYLVCMRSVIRLGSRG